jgi:mannosyltransferase OCH1-like enzyme
MIYGKNIKNIMLISDIFRLELLNTFGGIYIDIDSLPSITFDEQLLFYNRFCVSRKSGQKIISDNYFMG